MKYTFFIAKRYLLAKKEAGFITVISMISIAGVTVGVAALIVILSVFNGFNSLVTGILVGFDPHVRIQLSPGITDPERRQFNEYMDQREDIIGRSAFVAGKGMLISKRTTKVIFIRGLESEKISSVSGLSESMIVGTSNFSPDDGEVVLGYSLADKLGISVDDTIYVVTSAGVQDALSGFALPQLFPLRIIGIYEAKNKDYDGLYAFTSLSTAQTLFAAPAPQGYEVRLRSIDDAESMTSDIRERFPSAVTAETWFDLHKDLYSVMQVERWTAFIILMLIIGVASFNLLGSLTMTVIEKTRDIGILKAMGATQQDIHRIFRLEGFLVGISGSILGLVIGTFICWIQTEYQVFGLDSTVYIIPAIPVEMRASDLIVVPLSAVLLCSIAAYYPARRAALLQPSEAVRWE